MEVATVIARNAALTRIRRSVALPSTPTKPRWPPCASRCARCDGPCPTRASECPLKNRETLYLSLSPPFLTPRCRSAASAPDGAADGSGGGEATELKMHLVQVTILPLFPRDLSYTTAQNAHNSRCASCLPAQEDELVSRLRELSRIVAAASVKRLSQANGEPALDVRAFLPLMHLCNLQHQSSPFLHSCNNQSRYAT
jgi:hypothetical protein